MKYHVEMKCFDKSDLLLPRLLCWLHVVWMRLRRRGHHQGELWSGGGILRVRCSCGRSFWRRSDMTPFATDHDHPTKGAP